MQFRAAVLTGLAALVLPAQAAAYSMAFDTVTIVGAELVERALAGISERLALVALGIGRARPLMAFVERHQGVVRVVSGGLIVSVGILVATNAFSRLAGLVRWGY